MHEFEWTISDDFLAFLPNSQVSHTHLGTFTTDKPKTYSFLDRKFNVEKRKFPKRKCHNQLSYGITELKHENFYGNIYI